MSLSGRSRKPGKVFAIAAAGAVIAAISLVYAWDQNNRYGEVPCADGSAPLTGTGASALIVGFTTMEQAVANSDAIVVADVEKCVKVHSHPKSKEIRLTDIEVTVERSIKGDMPVGGTATVQLVTSGEDADYHVMKAGERYVLFLTFSHATSSYVPVGGPQGRFIIVDGLVYSLDGIHPDLSFINVKVEGQPLDDFLSEIQPLSSQ